MKLPEPWNIETSNDTVKDSAFEFSHKVSKREDGPGVILASRYRALADWGSSAATEIPIPPNRRGVHVLPTVHRARAVHLDKRYSLPLPSL